MVLTERKEKNSIMEYVEAFLSDFSVDDLLDFSNTDAFVREKSSPEKKNVRKLTALPTKLHFFHLSKISYLFPALTLSSTFQ